MIFNRYVFFLFTASLLSISALYLVLKKLDPLADQTLALLLFFISLFFSVSGISGLIGYLIRVFIFPDELFFNHFNVSLRQGMILGITLCALMGFQVLGTLSWWNVIIILIISFMIELYFAARE